MSEKSIKVMHDSSLCTGCGGCVSICARGCFQSAGGLVSISDSAANLCLGCGHCIALCPVNAIKLKGFEDYIPERVEKNISHSEMKNFLKGRRTVRFYSEQDVPFEKIEELIDVARYAPTGHNSQNYSFEVIRGRDDVRAVGADVLSFYEKIVKMTDSPFGRLLLRFAAGKNYSSLMVMKGSLKRHVARYKETGKIGIVWGAPCLILIHGPESSDSVMNATLAGSNIILQAEALGLGSCILGLLHGGINRIHDRLESRGIKIPKGNRIHMCLSVGVPADFVKFRFLPPRNKANVNYI